MTGPLRGHASRVYFIRSGESGPIKIGYAVNAYGRFHNLQAGNPEVLTYLGHIDGDRDVEKSWHDRFRHLHIRGEWHQPAPELLEAITAAFEAQKPVDEERARQAATATAIGFSKVDAA